MSYHISYGPGLAFFHVRPILQPLRRRPSGMTTHTFTLQLYLIRIRLASDKQSAYLVPTRQTSSL
jgi:hypothetical protein